MTLFAYNITGSTVTLAAGKPTPVLPPSASPPARGPGVDVTSELKWLSDAEYALLEAQRPDTIQYEWSGDEEFSLGTLVSGAISIHVPSSHASTHATGGGDPLTVASTTAVSQTTAPTNQPATATNQNATATNQNATVTNQNATVTNQNATLAHHETFLQPDAVGVVLGTISEATAVTSGESPPHPTNLTVDFYPGWSGGDIQVDGRGADGQSVSEVFPASPGAVVTGVKAFISIDTDGITNSAPIAGVDAAQVKTGRRLGLASSTPVSVFKFTVDANAVTPDDVDQSERTVQPSSSDNKNGTRSYEVWYTTDHTHVQDTHTHVQDAHTHTQNVHLHVQDAHTHTQNTHTHTQDAHTHDTSG